MNPDSFQQLVEQEYEGFLVASDPTPTCGDCKNYSGGCRGDYEWSHCEKGHEIESHDDPICFEVEL